MVRQQHAPSTGFKLPEILVMVAVGVVFVGILLPAIAKVREMQGRIRCAENFRRLGFAVQRFADVNESKLPDLSRRYGPLTPAGGTDQIHVTNLNAFMVLLPHLQQDSLYQSCISGITTRGTPSAVSMDASEGLVGSPASATPVRLISVRVFQCPKDPGVTDSGQSRNNSSWAAASYAFNYQVFATSGTTTCTSQYRINTVPDGSSLTIFIAEKYTACNRLPHGTGTSFTGGALWAHPPGEPNWGAAIANNRPDCSVPAAAPYLQNWSMVPQIRPVIAYSPTDPNVCDVARVSSGHSGGTLVEMGDGSVKFVSQYVTEQVWREALEPDSGLPLPASW